MFSFIVHLRDESEREAGIFFPEAENPLQEFEKQRITKIPYVRSSVKKNGKIIGYIIAIPLSSAEIIMKSGRYAVLEAVKLAQNLGCDKVGLGALTKSVTNGGKWIIEQPGITAVITNANSLPTGMTIEGIKKLVNKNDSLTIIGAYGNIGETLSKNFAQDKSLKELVLIGKNRIKLEILKNQLDSQIPIKLSLDACDARNSEVVVSTTNAPDAFIKSEHLKKGAIIYDISQPRNCGANLIQERPDIKIIDGPLCEVPANLDFWWMGNAPHTTFPCMCETILYEEFNISEYSVGSLNLNFIRKVTEYAKIYDFKLAPFTSFGAPINV